MSHFADETKLTRINENNWCGHINGQWSIGDNPNGGYLVANAMNAIRELAPDHPDPLSVTAHYLRPGVPDSDCDIEARMIRRGRTLTTASASLSQNGKSRIEVLAAFGDLMTPGAANAVKNQLTIPAPVIPKPEDCPVRSAKEQGVDLPLLSRMDIRIHPDQAKSGHGDALMSGWIRFQDDTPADTLAAVMFLDAFVPSVFGVLGVIGWVPTLELTVHVRRRPAPGWLLGQFRTRDLAEGRMVEDGLLWDNQGQLIAQSRQIGLVMQR